MSESDFVPTNSLETTLMRAAVDPTERPEFFRLLVESVLFVLTPMPRKEGIRVAGDNEELSIVNWTAGDRRVIPVFTSVDWLRQAVPSDAGPYGYAGMKGKTLFEMLATGGTAVALNPHCPYGKELSVEEMLSLAKGEGPGHVQKEVVRKDREILLGQPAVYPQALVDAVRRRLPMHPQVRAAYLGWMHEPATDVPPHAVIGLELAPGSDRIGSFRRSGSWPTLRSRRTRSSTSQCWGMAAPSTRICVRNTTILFDARGRPTLRIRADVVHPSPASSRSDEACWSGLQPHHLRRTRQVLGGARLDLHRGAARETRRRDGDSPEI